MPPTERTLTLGLPARMNTDLSPELLDPDEAVDLYNTLIHEPGQLRSRKGPVFKCAFPGSKFTSGHHPVGYASTTAKFVSTQLGPSNTRMLVTLMGGSLTSSPKYHQLTPGTDSTLGGTTTASVGDPKMTWSNPAVSSLTWGVHLVNADTATAWKTTVINNFGASSGWEVGGPSCQYFNCAYYTSVEVVQCYWPTAYVTPTAPYQGTRLFRWGGALPTTPAWKYAYIFTNGATLGTVHAQVGTVTTGTASSTQTITVTAPMTMAQFTVGQGVWFYNSTLTTARGAPPFIIQSVNVGANQITFTGSVTTTTGDVVLFKPSQLTTGNPSGYFLACTADAYTAFPYSYMITSLGAITNVSATDWVIIDKPYGIGQAVGVVPDRTLASGWVTQPIAPVIASPGDAQGCHTYLNRVFVGRASLGAPLPLSNGATLPSAIYPNAIAWCQAGNPEVWPASNWALVDDSPHQSIMGFATAGNQLLIFRQNSIFMMSGTDESNFTFEPLTLELGCIDGRSITPYRNGCVFMSRYGMYYTDGTQIRDLTQSKPAHGIRTAYRDQTKNFAFDTSPQSIQATGIIPGSDYCMMAGNDGSTAWSAGATGYDGDNYAMFLPGPNAQTISYYYIPNGSWCRTGNNDATINFSNATWMFTQIGKHINNKCIGFTRSGAYELDRMVEAEVRASEVVDPTITNTALEAMLTTNTWTTTPAAYAAYTWTDFTPPLGFDYCLSDANTGVLIRGLKKIPLQIQYRDLKVGDGDTVRISDVFIDHNCFYTAAATNAPNQQGWNVSVAVDPALTTATQLSAIGAPTGLYNMIQPRYEGTTFAASLYDKSYTSEPDGAQNWEVRCKVARVVLNNSYINAQTTPAMSYKLFDVRLRVATISPTRIDNPVV